MSRESFDRPRRYNGRELEAEVDSVGKSPGTCPFFPSFRCDTGHVPLPLRRGDATTHKARTLALSLVDPLRYLVFRGHINLILASFNNACRSLSKTTKSNKLSASSIMLVNKEVKQKHLVLHWYIESVGFLLCP